MNKIDIAKRIVSGIVGLGTTKIVTSIIENNVTTDSKASELSVKAAGVAIGYAAGDGVSKYTDAKIDEIIAWYKTNRNVQPD